MAKVPCGGFELDESLALNNGKLGLAPGAGSGGGGGFTDYYTENARVYHDADFTRLVTKAEVMEAVKTTTIRIASEHGGLFDTVIRVDLNNDWADLYTLEPDWNTESGCSFGKVSTAEWKSPIG